MIKSLAIASTLLIAGAGSVLAAEVGYLTQSGSSSYAVTNGRSYNSFNGNSVTRSRTVEVNGALGGAGGSIASAGGGGVVGGLDRTVSTTRTKEYFRGGSNNRFSGSSTRAFSSTSLFAN